MIIKNICSHEFVFEIIIATFDQCGSSNIQEVNVCLVPQEATDATKALDELVALLGPVCD